MIGVACQVFPERFASAEHGREPLGHVGGGGQSRGQAPPIVRAGRLVEGLGPTGVRGGGGDGVGGARQVREQRFDIAGGILQLSQVNQRTLDIGKAQPSQPALLERRRAHDRDPAPSASSGKIPRNINPRPTTSSRKATQLPEITPESTQITAVATTASFALG